MSVPTNSCDQKGLEDCQHLVVKEQRLRQLFDELLNEQEVYWAQRAKQTWMVMGDRNTSFFQRVASVRSRRNRIVLLKSEDRDLFSDQDAIEQMFVSHFTCLFEGGFVRNDGRNNLASVLEEGDCVPCVLALDALGIHINDSQIRDLEERFTEVEVRATVFQRRALRLLVQMALWRDFIKKYWSWVGQDVVQMVLAFLHSGSCCEKSIVASKTDYGSG